MPFPRLTALVAIVLLGHSLAAQDTASKATAPPLPTAPSVQIDGFLQLWYLDGHTITSAHDSYRVRRADLKLSGVISPRVRWRVSLDGAKLLNLNKTTTVAADSTALRDVSVDQRSRILQEASINVVVAPALRLDVGQQIIPLSLEGTIASPQIETIQRTMFIEERSRGGTLGDIRDIGAAARGSFAAGVVEYQLGLFNEMGESQNSTDQNDQKAAIGRIAFHVPRINQLQVGASGGFEGGSFTQRRERAGGEAQFRGSWLTLRSEVMGARDGAIRRLGYYGLAAARPRSDIELVARWDDWDPDLHNESGPADVDERQIVAGASYFIESAATRLAANLVHSTFPSGRVPESTQLLLELHVVW
ncbi:MAG TPA: porin [Steroidobacteraceae bacterium]